MSGDVVCDCSLCPCGAPKKFKLTISGVTGCGDTPCDPCGVNGEYILEQTPAWCGWRFDEPGRCWTNAWNLSIRQKDDCTMELVARLSRRRWFSFTLQTLLLVVTVVCVALAPIGAAFLRLRAARQLQKNGVSVQWEDGDCVDDG